MGVPAVEMSNKSSSWSNELSYSYVPWLKSPVNNRRRVTQTNTADSKLPPLESRIIDGDEEDLHEDGVGVPTFRQHHEASSLELYYDLYFIANLTTFAAHHDIEDLESTTFCTYV
jgi:hypothetical protein